MPGATNPSRRRARLRGMGLILLGPFFAGCAAMSQDVDAYYRQMAINYQEAVDNAKRDEVSLENQMRILGVTNDQTKYLKAQRKLEKLKAWEEKCAYQQKRFEKAADWMESHFDIKKPNLDGKANAGVTAVDKAIGNDLKSPSVDSTDSDDTRGHNIKETLVE
jgi:hypothetical protein